MVLHFDHDDVVHLLREECGKSLILKQGRHPSSASRGTICPGGILAYTGLWQVSRTICRSSGVNLFAGAGRDTRGRLSGLISAIFGPALVGANVDSCHLAGRRKTGTISARIIDQLNNSTAIRGADHSSSGSSQIACTFFCSTSKAAASARAFSLRWSSFSRSLMRLRLVFCSDFSLMPACLSQSLAASQALRHTLSWSGINAFAPAVFSGFLFVQGRSFPAQLQTCPGQSSLPDWYLRLAAGCPFERASLRQLYNVGSLMPSSLASWLIDRLCGGIIFSQHRLFSFW